MSQQSTTRNGVALSSPEVRSGKKPRIIPSSFMSPPSSPPPTSPLPLPPISPSPLSSAHSRTPPPRPPRSPISLPDLRPTRFNSAEYLRPSFDITTTPPSTSSRLQNSSGSFAETLVQQERHLQAHGSATFQTGNHSFDDVNRVLLKRSENDQMWWSQTMTTPLPFDSVSVGLPDIDSAPQIPPISGKRKTQRPPQRFVARSALYIPSALYSEESHSDRVTIPSSPPHPGRALLHDDPITSLPPWPGTIRNAIRIGGKNEKERSCRSEAKVSHLSKHSASHGRSSQEKACLVHSAEERHISFCAVTNLEEPTPEVETVSAKGRVTSQPTRRAWCQQHRKQLWIMATIAAVVLTTAVIVGSIIWRLTRAP